MKIFRRVLICILSVMMIGGTVSAVGCSTTEESLTDPQFVHVYPQKVTGHLSNPGMGWVGIEETINYGQVEVGGAGNLPEVDVVSIESTWNYLEPEKDHFDFDLMDRTIEYWTGLGKRINFRIMTDMLVLGFTWNGAPEWLINDPRVGYEVSNLTNRANTALSILIKRPICVLRIIRNVSVFSSTNLSNITAITKR